MSANLLPDVYFGVVGPAGQALPEEDTFADYDNDEELDGTPQDVIDILGFDPVEFEEDPDDDIGDAEYDDASQGDIIACDSWFAFDDSEWEEAKHPRGKGGKFAKTASGFHPTNKKTSPDNLMLKALKAYGYTKSKTSEGVHSFKHESGHNLHIGPSKPDQAHLSGYHLENIGKYGKGAGALVKHLESLHGEGTPVPNKPAMAAAPKSEAKPVKVEPPKEIAHKNTTVTSLLAEKGFKPHAESEHDIQYLDDKGNSLYVAKKYNTNNGGFEWTFTDVDGHNQVAGTKFGQFIKQADQLTYPPKLVDNSLLDKSPDHVVNSLAEAGFKPDLEGDGWTSFKNSDGYEVTVSNQLNGNGNYNWTMKDELSGGTYTGSGLGSLKKKFTEIKEKGASKKEVNELYEELSKPVEVPTSNLAPPKHLLDFLPHSKTVAGNQIFYNNEDSAKSTETLFLQGGEGEGKGAWSLWSELEGSQVGKGQETLDAAFEALHPRDEHGYFVAKPGESEFEKELQKLAPEEEFKTVYTGIVGGGGIYAGKSGEISVGTDGTWYAYDPGGKLIKEGDALGSLYDYLSGIKKAGGPAANTVPQSNAVSAFVKGGGSSPPSELNGIPFKSWIPPADWSKVEGQNLDLKEPPMNAQGKKVSAGVLIQEPDGRVWLMKPTNGFGYNYTFPKGGQEIGLTLQQTAIKEAYEETGLKVEITGYAGDYAGTTSMTRYYLAKRTGGTPIDYESESEGSYLVPKDQLDNYLNADRDKQIMNDHLSGVASSPKIAVGQPIQFDNLKKVGPQLGSNPGGQYEDADGNKYYVKQVQSNNHANSELLAAALFGAAGGDTFAYVPVDHGDKKYVATKWELLEKNNMDQLTPDQKKAAQKQFAIQAWLGNWDAAGLTGDNVGVLKGKVIPLDFGGSLNYRAQGAPKAYGAFGSQANDFDTLRDKTVNPKAAELYGDMTPAQLMESANQLKSVSDQKIEELVQKYNMHYSMVQILTARKYDVIQRAAEAGQPKTTLHTAMPGTSKYNPDQNRKTVAEWNPPSQPTSAIGDYKGANYKPMNALLRFGKLEDKNTSTAADNIRKITNWLDKASTKEDLVVWRGVPHQVADLWHYMAEEGGLLTDSGFMSMSTSKAFSDAWHGGSGLTLQITVPKGAKMGTVRGIHQEDGEYELLGQRMSNLRINKWDRTNKIFHVTWEPNDEV